MLDDSPVQPTASRGFHLLLPISCCFLFLSVAALIGLLAAKSRVGIVQAGVVFVANGGFGLVLLISWYREHARLLQLAQVARSLNLAFVDRVYVDALDPFATLPLFRLTAGYNIQQTGWMEGTFAGQPVILLEYHYGGHFQTGRLWQVHLSGQRLIVILPRVTRLPEFVLCPRDSFWNRDSLAPLANLHAGPPVPLDGTLPDRSTGPFAEHYVLRGLNAPPLRNLFQPRLLDWFAAEPGWTVESANGTLLVYHEGQAARPDLCSRLLHKAVSIRAALCSSSSSWSEGVRNRESGVREDPAGAP
jgi:hypothetical protein